jgi:hypothetical protein
VKTKLGSMVLLCAIAGAALPVCAQQASDAEKTPPAGQQNSTPASNASSDDAAATAALIAKANAAAAKAATSASSKATSDASLSKKAREAGWRPEAHNGETVYCRDDAQVGSRFATRRCVHENQLLVLLDQAQADKDSLKSVGCNGGACSAGK